MADKYVLVDGEPEPSFDLLSWARWLETADRKVAATEVGDAMVSTIFVGLDHSFGDGPPLLWETMIFGGPHDQFQERYSTLADAKAGHERAVAMAKGNPESIA